MSRKPNFADPDYEPTDDDLTRLMQEAFADLPQRRAEALRAHQERLRQAELEALHTHADLLRELRESRRRIGQA